MVQIVMIVEVYNRWYYFDYNPAIVTDKVITKIVKPLSVTPSVKPSFSILPNPSNSYIFLEDIPFAKGTFKIIDISGNLVSDGIITNSGNSKIKIHQLTSGKYIIIIKSLKTKKTYSSTFVKI